MEGNFMKVLLPRIGALVIVVVLGIIAMAQAQRNNNKMLAEDTGTTIGNASESLGAANDSNNPLRNNTSTDASSAGFDAASPSNNPTRQPIADPFGLQKRANTANNSAANTSAASNTSANTANVPAVSNANTVNMSNANATGNVSGGASSLYPYPSSVPQKNNVATIPAATTPAPAADSSIPDAPAVVQQTQIQRAPAQGSLESPRNPLRDDNLREGNASASTLPSNGVKKSTDDIKQPQPRNQASGFPKSSQEIAQVSAEQPIGGPDSSGSSRSDFSQNPPMRNERTVALAEGMPDTMPQTSNRAANAMASNAGREPKPLTIDPFDPPATPLKAAAPLKVAANERPGTNLPPLENRSAENRNAERNNDRNSSRENREARGMARLVSADSSGPTMDPASEMEGVGQPGGKQLEGAQSPQLTIQKIVPKEVQINKPAVFRVVVRNAGQVPACEVEVRDQVPRGAHLISTTPRAARNQNGDLVWRLGTLRAGEETSVEMQVTPTTEGEIGSVATVHFGADASARCVVTRPQLVLNVTTPKQVMIGDKVMLSIVVSNPGTGVATGVVLEEHIPEGMQHSAGSELEYEVGNLKPGESRKIDLPLATGRPGAMANLLVAHGDGNLRVEDKRTIEVIAPQLDVAMEGPKKRYLEREAVYQLSVANPGTASAKQVELVAYLPPGLKFVNANNQGSYDEAHRAVHWLLAELPAQETGSVELTTLPVEPGEQAIKVRGTAQKGLAVEREQPVLIEGIAALRYQVATSSNPIQLNGTTTYEVKVVNQGSKASNNIRLVVDLPQQLDALGADGPTQARRDGGGHVITFDPLARLAPKADTTYRIRVKGVQAGDLRAKFQLQSDEMQSPVTKEECTQVFADE
jgi:uncharacterized repeat protein (TIGR01451 family)